MSSKFNPFSKEGELDLLEFLLMMVILVAANLLVAAIFRGPIAEARLGAEKQMLMGLYGGHLLISLLSLSAIVNSFLKVYRGLRGENLGWLGRGAIKLFVLSPVLSIYLLIMTVTFLLLGKEKNLKDREKRNIVWLSSFVILQVMVMFVPIRLFNKPTVAIRSSLEEIIPGGIKLPNLPPDFVYALAYPSLTPTLRYGYWLVTDFFRAEALHRAVSTEDSALCLEKMRHMGAEIQDCYFASFRRMATRAKLATPLFGLYFESQYRQSLAQTRLDSGNLSAVSDSTGVIQQAVDEFAEPLRSISNLIELFESEDLIKDRRDFLAPSAVIRIFGSPEIPLIEAGQDFQRFLFAEKFLPMIQEQLEQVQKAYASVSGQLGEEGQPVAKEIERLSKLLKSYQSDPLRVRR